MRPQTWSPRMVVPASPCGVTTPPRTKSSRFEQVGREHKRLDVLAVVITGPIRVPRPRWHPPRLRRAQRASEQAKATFLAPMVEAGRFTDVDWELASKAEMPS